MPRIVELILASFLFLIFFPLMLLTAIAVKLTSKGPAIHWSKRVGQNNQLFLMPKFRSMKIETPQLATHLMKDEKNFLTAIGPFLRKTSLDELPQLWSVLKGDMSFVGPRPALFNQDDLISLRTKNCIHDLKPGITGWAQINGRDEITIEAKVELDSDYLNKRSFCFDCYIILRTLYSVILGNNIKH